MELYIKKSSYQYIKVILKYFKNIILKCLTVKTFDNLIFYTAEHHQKIQRTYGNICVEPNLTQKLHGRHCSNRGNHPLVQNL